MAGRKELDPRSEIEIRDTRQSRTETQDRVSSLGLITSWFTS